MNELLLIISVPLIFGSVLLSLKLFGKSGLFAASAVFTVVANIEVLILVDAFGFEQTLGNVLFASTFLITDILSECFSQKDANRAVNIGIYVSVVFIILSQLWFLYIPSENDFVLPAVKTVFKNTPRLMLASIAVYAICQKLDIVLYHKIWSFTEKKTGNKKAVLWLRNNLATLISQLANTVLFNIIAFWGIHSFSSILSIIISGYVICIFTSILDTPFVYSARKINTKTQQCNKTIQ